MRVSSPVVLAVSLLLAACSDLSGSSGAGTSAGQSGGSTNVGTDGGSPDGLGTVRIFVTDAPIDPAMVSAAVVDVDQVSVHTDDGFTTVLDETVSLDLLDLRNGVTQLLTEADLPPGALDQVRLHVAGGMLELVNGRMYTTEDGSLQLTSQDTSGFKVNIEPPVQIVDGFPSNVLLDFDLSKMFKPVPANDPLNAAKYHLHPVIRGTSMELTGEISGLVQTMGQDGLEPVDMATVYLLPPGVTDLDMSLASTVSEADGHYAFLGLESGSYDLFAQKGTLESAFMTVEVTQETTTNADIELLRTTGSISGTVTDESLAAVEGATVRALVGENEVVSTQTDADGHYAFDELAPDSYTISAAKDTLEGSAGPVELAAGDDLVVDVTLMPTTGSIAGLVDMDDGTGTLVPVADATVSILISGETDPSNAVATTMTAADGTYSVAGLQPGVYDVLATKDMLSGRTDGVMVTAGTAATADVTVQ